MSKTKSNRVEMEVIDVNEVESTPEDRRGKTLGLLWVIMYIALIVSICLVILTFILQRSVVDGSSMSPVLSDKESVLVNKTAYFFSSPKRFDIVVFRYDDGENSNFIRRIIGLPGETVSIKDGAVYINGVKLEDDTYCKEAIKDAGTAASSVALQDGQYFVLGDNRNASKDSRNAEIGVVYKEQIVGKVFFRIMPFGKFGGVK